MISFVINKDNEGQTIEKFVKKVLPDAPLSFIYKVFRKKDVKINKHWSDLKTIIKCDDLVEIYVTNQQLNDFKKNKEIKTSNIDISKFIIYEDKNVLVVNKPRNMLVQKDDKDSIALDDLVLSYLTKNNEYNPLNNLGFTPGPAHRIDRNTSGIVVFGKTAHSLHLLFDLFKDKENISKHYLTLVKGIVEDDGEVDAPLKKNSQTGKVFVCDKSNGGKPAKTIYHVKEIIGDFTLLDVILVTGRTHQIRVHMAHIGHPVVGDSKYGDFALNKEILNKYNFKNQFLHASEIHFGDLPEPLNNLKSKSFKADLPLEYNQLIEELKLQ